jgi:hypothetical protein
MGRRSCFMSCYSLKSRVQGAVQMTMVLGCFRFLVGSLQYNTVDELMFNFCEGYEDCSEGCDTIPSLLSLSLIILLCVIERRSRCTRPRSILRQVVSIFVGA